MYHVIVLTKLVVVVLHKNWLLLLRVVINCALRNNIYNIYNISRLTVVSHGAKKKQAYMMNE